MNAVTPDNDQDTPGEDPRFEFVVATIGALLGITVTTMLLTFVTKNCTKAGDFSASRFWCTFVAATTLVMAFSLGEIFLVVAINRVIMGCEAAYIITAGFWVVIKSATQMWFVEKLYILRYCKRGVNRKRCWQFCLNVLMVVIQSITVIHILVIWRYSDVSLNSNNYYICYLGIKNHTIILIATLYQFFWNVYLASHFIKPLEPLTDTYARAKPGYVWLAYTIDILMGLRPWQFLRCFQPRRITVDAQRFRPFINVRRYITDAKKHFWAVIFTAIIPFSFLAAIFQVDNNLASAAVVAGMAFADCFIAVAILAYFEGRNWLPNPGEFDEEGIEVRKPKLVNIGL
ncbi:hypothetical protein RUND412_008377 [Rhizina undulata]